MAKPARATETFPQFLCRIRVERDLTWAALGRRLCVGAPTIKAWEAGLNPPQPSKRDALAEWLAVERSDLDAFIDDGTPLPPSNVTSITGSVVPSGAAAIFGHDELRTLRIEFMRARISALSTGNPLSDQWLKAAEATAGTLELPV